MTDNDCKPFSKQKLMELLLSNTINEAAILLENVTVLESKWSKITDIFLYNVFQNSKVVAALVAAKRNI